MPRRKVEPAPAPCTPRCEVCDSECDNRLPRTAKGGLLCCFACLSMSGAELAVAYGRRLRRIAER